MNDAPIERWMWVVPMLSPLNLKSKFKLLLHWYENSLWMGNRNKLKNVGYVLQTILPTIVHSFQKDQVKMSRRLVFKGPEIKGRMALIPTRLNGLKGNPRLRFDNDHGSQQPHNIINRNNSSWDLKLQFRVNIKVKVLVQGKVLIYRLRICWMR